MVATAAEELALDARIGELMGKINADALKPRFTTTLEADCAIKALEWGRLLDSAKFMYFNYDLWRAVALAPQYKPLYDAMTRTAVAITPTLAAEIKKKGTSEVYSMGPSPVVDKALLENLVTGKTKITYHVVDTSERAISETLDEITQHLSAKFGKEWQDYITIAEPQQSAFGSVKSSKPSCIIYSGGTLMNSVKFWEQAPKLAGEGGMVVATAALTPDESDYSAYWLGMYGIPENKKMFKEALRLAFPDLFKSENRGKWSVEFEHIPMQNRFARWAQYQTPRISAQLRVKEDITLTVNNPRTGEPAQVYLHPTRTWAEVAEWEDHNSEFRKAFDNDSGIAAKIMEYWQTGNRKALPEESRKSYPIELAQSAKLMPQDFLLLLPGEFGMKMNSFTLDKISRKGGQSGLAAAAIYDVGKAPAAGFRPEEMGVPKAWPQGYPQDPAFLASTRASAPRN